MKKYSQELVNVLVQYYLEIISAKKDRNGIVWCHIVPGKCLLGILCVLVPKFDNKGTSGTSLVCVCLYFVKVNRGSSRV